MNDLKEQFKIVTDSKRNEGRMFYYSFENEAAVFFGCDYYFIKFKKENFYLDISKFRRFEGFERFARESKNTEKIVDTNVILVKDKFKYNKFKTESGGEFFINSNFYKIFKGYDTKISIELNMIYFYNSAGELKGGIMLSRV